MTPNIPHTFYRVSIKALILDETRSKFLVGKEKNGKWSLLGGGLNWGETIDACLERELKEEAGLEINTIIPNAAYFISGQRDDDDWSIDIVHEVVVKDLNVIPSDECVEIKFVTAQEAKELTSYKTLQRFAQVFDSAIHRSVMRSSKNRSVDV
jgi:ADP-ribose pyrophosphatase YjhB (NUDIX family)